MVCACVEIEPDVIDTTECPIHGLPMTPPNLCPHGKFPDNCCGVWAEGN